MGLKEPMDCPTLTNYKLCNLGKPLNFVPLVSSFAKWKLFHLPRKVVYKLVVVYGKLDSKVL